MQNKGSVRGTVCNLCNHGQSLHTWHDHLTIEGESKAADAGAGAGAGAAGATYVEEQPKIQQASVSPLAANSEPSFILCVCF